ncbi:IclR family transcriptional regulator [Brachybacterium sacelli]|uniref:DNA-binding IclR family transcriptional regulator n=1 Tax=Brachybacterium sacelli TaxID=173364 RepID=A0ABS4WYP7_9MICO|nr:IclR family transcriptional regulator [Brachybacterium sacelli]MBP2381334.1 DNA-binding IclR family transcriptional regulator [Brachybacterium sacelli]
MANTPSNQSIERAVAVLQAIGTADAESVRASDIARIIDLGASTTGRILATLENLGYVRRGPQGYRIGTAALLLASQGLNHDPVHRESRARAQELAQRIGLTSNVGVRDEGRAIYLCHFEGARASKSHTMIGMDQPLHASALGKCLLLDLSEQERISLLGDLPKYTERTITDHADLGADLDVARRRGWAMEDQEVALGRFCAAAPIRDARGRIVAALSISGRISDLRSLDLPMVTEDVIEVADRISVGLGMITAVPEG